ncbi:carbohydrate ABC transporter permease [Paenibacillus nasutitermitis]|uniref:Sugar ABC transporter ATP-binding protein n=1 Tax=Paenibacillus nasutitermitis TaxID=1652958 RepID=A0A916ZGX5_9BACL|nr:carbohydrate ABC transporter permease [Paenibacillus nasutitermitis]GGD96742.1 sugar ABC transporter ATP-binding protein [Paenibacillus nasutitermitis]
MKTTIYEKMIRFCIFIVLLLIALVVVYPLFYMFTSSIKTSLEFSQNPLALPETLYLDNFKALYFRFSLVKLFSNTLIAVGGALILSFALSVPASFAFAKIRFKYRSTLYMAMIATMTIPGITFIIPNYLLMSKLGLIDNFLSVIIIWGVGSVANNVFLLTSLMRGLPNEVLEAVKMDGGSYLQVMTKIVVPLSIPGLMTVSIFNTTGWWNDLLTPLVYLQSDQMKTMTVAVATILRTYSSDYPLLLAGLFMTSVPPIVIYIILQGYIRKGLVIGAVK